MLHSATRDRLLAAASHILETGSLSQLSIDRIAERACVSRRTFFLHFKCKDDLMSEVLTNLRANHDKAMRQWSEDLPAALTTEERILEIFRRILLIIRQPDWRGSSFLRLSGELADLRGHPIHEVVAAAKRDQRDWFERELQSGGYRNPALLADQVLIIMTGLFQIQLLDGSNKPGDEVLDLLPRLLAAHR